MNRRNRKKGHSRSQSLSDANSFMLAGLDDVMDPIQELDEYNKEFENRDAKENEILIDPKENKDLMLLKIQLDECIKSHGKHLQNFFNELSEADYSTEIQCKRMFNEIKDLITYLEIFFSQNAALVENCKIYPPKKSPISSFINTKLQYYRHSEKKI